MTSPGSATFLPDSCIRDAGVIQNFTVNIGLKILFSFLKRAFQII